MLKPTTYSDLDGNIIHVGNVLRDKDGDLAMVFGDDKSGYHLSTNRYNRGLTDFPGWPQRLDNVSITELQLRIDHGEWMVIVGTETTFHATYEDAKMSDLFGTPSISYFSENDRRCMDNILKEWI